MFIDLDIGFDNDRSVNRIKNVVERCTTDNAVTQRFNDLAVPNDRFRPDTANRSAILFGNDHVLCNVNQTTCQITRVSGFERRISQTFTRTVRRNKVLQNVQTFTEISNDRIFDDFARRFCHQSAHSGKLPDLGFRTTRPGIGHHEDRVKFVTFFFANVHRFEHFFGNLIGHI